MYFELPYPPSLNAYYRHVGNRVLLSNGGRKYRRLVCDIVRAEMHAADEDTLLCSLSCVISIRPPDPKRVMDCDNALKALLDALQHAGAYKNDRQICHLVVTRSGRMYPPAGIVRVLLTPWEE